MHVQSACSVLDPHALVEERAAACPRSPCRGPPAGARWRSAKASPSASSARIAGRIERSASEKAPASPNASAVCSAREARAKADGQRVEPDGCGEADRDARGRGRRADREPGDVVVERDEQPARAGERVGGLVGGAAGAEGDVGALGVQPEGGALTPQLVRAERPGQQREHERVAALLLLARVLELDLAVRGGHDVHHRVAPVPQRLAERQHGADVGALTARELAEARPHRGDRDPVGVQDGVDGHALLGALAADGGGAGELLGRRVAQFAQGVKRA